MPPDERDNEVKKFNQLSAGVKMLLTIVGTVGSLVFAGSFFLSDLEHGINDNAKSLVRVGGVLKELKEHDKVQESRMDDDTDSLYKIQIEQRVMQEKLQTGQDRAQEFERRTDKTLERILRKLEGSQ